MVRKGRQCLWLERVPVPTSCMHYGGSVTTFRSNRHRHSHYTVLLGTPLLAPLECAPAALWLDYTVTCLTQHTWKLVLVGEPVLAPAPKVAVVLERTNIYVYSIRTTQGEVLPSMDSTMVRQGSLLLAWSALCFSLCQCATVPIDRLPRSVMTREVFEEYMNKGRLLVVEGGASEWKALDEWDLDWFISRFPDDAIQLRSARSGMTYEERPQMTLGEYKGWVADKLDGKHYFSWVNNDETVSQQHLQEYVHLLQCPSSLAYSHKARTLPPGTFRCHTTFPPMPSLIGTRSGFTLERLEAGWTVTWTLCVPPSGLFTYVASRSGYCRTRWFVGVPSTPPHYNPATSCCSSHSAFWR